MNCQTKKAQIPQSNDLITSHMNDVENKAGEFRETEMASQTGKSGSSQSEEVIWTRHGKIGKIWLGEVLFIMHSFL